MGNTATKTYGQVSTFDDSKNDNNDSNLTFVFHTTEDDCTDRVVHDNDLTEDFTTYTYTIFQENQVIAQRNDFEDHSNIDQLIPLLNAGDIVEFITKDNESHWVVYVGSNSCIHLKSDKVLKSEMGSIHKDCWAKLVNNVYVFKPLPVVQVLQNAESQIGKVSMWCNSECFSMWCRTGKAEFTTAPQSIVRNLDLSPSKQIATNYKLQLKTGNEELTKNFSSLSKLVEFRKKMELPYNRGLNALSL